MKRLFIALIGMCMASSSPSGANTAFKENQPHFVLSEETPISTGHGFIGTSTSTEAIDMLSYGVHFRVPRNYIDSAMHHLRDRTLDFTLVTLYPDFIGADTERKSMQLTPADEVWIWGSSPNLINITTVGGALGRKRKADYNTAVLDAEAHEPDQPWQYGLLKSTHSRSMVQNVYFTRPKAGDSGTVIFCSQGKGSVHDCVMYLRVSDDLLMHCKFHIELLPHWQEIHQRLTQLIQSFIVKDN